MEIFEGLDADQVQSITSTANYRQLDPGEIIFNKDDEANEVYIVLSGRVEIFKPDDMGGEQILAKIGQNEIFGEIGFFMEDQTRSAGARASGTGTAVISLPRNPADMLRGMRDIQAAMIVLQNVICIMGETLQEVDSRKFSEDTVYVAPEKALETITRQLPTGFLAKYFKRKTVKPDDMLCWEGDPSDSFFFIHAGELEVLKLDPHRKFKKLGVMKAPTVAGELGFFAGIERSACLRAATEVDYTIFSGRDFEKLKKDQPLDAMKVLYAAAQLVANLIVAD
jgi:CRP-like cAMP-binding protein